MKHFGDITQVHGEDVFAVKTNADKIRSMSDEELANILARICDWTFPVDFDGDEKKWLEWLQEVI